MFHTNLKNAGVNTELCAYVRHVIIDVTARFVALGGDEAWRFGCNQSGKAHRVWHEVGHTVCQRRCGLSTVKRTHMGAAGAAAVESDNASNHMRANAAHADGKEIDNDGTTSPLCVRSADMTLWCKL